MAYAHFLIHRQNMKRDRRDLLKDGGFGTRRRDRGPRRGREGSADQLGEATRRAPALLPTPLEHPRGLGGLEPRLVRQAEGLEVAGAERQSERDTLARGKGRQRRSLFRSQEVSDAPHATTIAGETSPCCDRG